MSYCHCCVGFLRDQLFLHSGYLSLKMLLACLMPQGSKQGEGREHKPKVVAIFVGSKTCGNNSTIPDFCGQLAPVYPSYILQEIPSTCADTNTGRMYSNLQPKIPEQPRMNPKWLEKNTTIEISPKNERCSYSYYKIECQEFSAHRTNIKLVLLERTILIGDH